MEQTQPFILRSIAPVTASSFEILFKQHFKSLFAYAFTIIKDEMMAEELTQQVFTKLWERRESIDIHTSLKAYLFKSVYNDSLNYLKHKKVMAGYASYASRQSEWQQENATGKVLAAELNEKIRAALNELPEQCRTIFQMSRFEHMKYQEIADALQLSVKTIENQMGKALKIMRVQLADYLPAVVFLFINL